MLQVSEESLYKYIGLFTFITFQSYQFSQP